MATILVDPRRQIDAIHPNIYGNFIEHLRRCIYGGIYEEGSPLADKKGFRRDVFAAIKSLKVPNIRWPRWELCISVPLDGWHRSEG